MASVNIVVLCGNITREPQVRHIPPAMSVCDLGMAVNESYKNKAGELVENTVFVDVVVWGKTAEACGQCLRKGSPVLVEGRLQLDTWEKDGEKRSKLRVRADRVQFLGSKDARDRAPATAAPAGASGSGAGPTDEIPFAAEL